MRSTYPPFTSDHRQVIIFHFYDDVITYPSPKLYVGLANNYSWKKPLVDNSISL